MDTCRPFDQLARDPIFIVGAARSGTTWLYDILTTHPAVAGVFESWLFTPENGLRNLFGPAHFPGKYSGLGRLLERGELLGHTRDMAIRVMSHAIQPGQRFLVEKSPSHLFAMLFIREVFPGARFIHILRDGRDVGVSVRAASRSWMQAWQDTFGRTVRSSARAWKHAVKRAHHDRGALGDSFLEIRYEDVRQDPFEAYRRMFDFCSIPYDEPLLQTIFQATDFARNYQPKETAFRRGGRVGDWRRQLGLLDAFSFHREAGDLLLDLQYEHDRGWWWKHFLNRKRG